jgi:hypothetical protein
MGILFLVAVTIFVGVFIDLFVLDLFPSSWILPLVVVFSGSVAGVVVLWVSQAVNIRRRQRSKFKELGTITEEERAVLKTFIHGGTLKSMKLDVSSKTVQQLEQKGLIVPTTGIVFKGQEQEPSYRFYTLSQDIFKLLIQEEKD